MKTAHTSLMRRYVAIMSWLSLVVLAQAQGELSAHFINVGQGDCTLIAFPNGKRLLVDCGSTDGPFDAAKVRDYIRRQLDPANPRIDLLVITHPDADHYNRIPAVFGDPDTPLIRIDRVLMVGDNSQYGSGQMEQWLDDYPAARRTSVQGQEYNVYPSKPLPGFEADGVRILAANVTSSFSASNAKSIVLKITYGVFDVMITGDATKDTDASILAQYRGHEPELDVEVWKAAHHGSWATASHDDRWAKVVRPELVVFSASATNTYGHPNRNLADTFGPYAAVVKSHKLLLWDGANKKTSPEATKPFRTKAMYSTSSNGNIVVRSDGQGFRVEFGVN